MKILDECDNLLTTNYGNANWKAMLLQEGTSTFRRPLSKISHGASRSFQRFADQVWKGCRQGQLSHTVRFYMERALSLATYLHTPGSCKKTNSVEDQAIISRIIFSCRLSS